jgi:AcrR family transcriptional regulator
MSEKVSSETLLQIAQPDGRSQRAQRRKERRNELILDALERLLETKPLRELGAEDIAEAAGIARSRFYFYYKSKHEALAMLVRRIADEVLAVYDLPDSWFAREPEGRPRDSLSVSFQRMSEVWRKHGAAVRESCDMWNAVPEVSNIWQQIMSGLAEATAAAIVRERKRGAAPEGPDPNLLAQSLVWQGERLLFLTLIGAMKEMHGEELDEVGTSIWMRAIYLADDPEPVG